MRYGAGDIFSFMMLNFDYNSKRLLWLTVYNSPPEVVFEMSDLRRDEGATLISGYHTRAQEPIGHRDVQE